ncbi:MAG: glycosyltransferase family 4 protein [Patescibacteria group bacterium]
MKILIVNKYWYPRGGADIYALWLADALHRAGHEVRVFTVDDKRNISSKFPMTTVSAVETERLSMIHAPRTMMRMLWSFEAVRKMKELVKEWRPDIVHLHNIYTQMSPSILPVLRERKIQTVMTVHDWNLLSANYALFDREGIDRNGSWWSVIKRRGVKDSFLASVIAAKVHSFHSFLRVHERTINRLIFTSEFAKKLFRAKGWRGDAGVVIPYVIDLAGVDITEKRDLGYFLFVGRLHETKGAHILIEAARKTGVMVKIVGDGPARERLKKQAGAMTNIEFLGARPRVETLELMRDARAVVVPSVWWEPFGLVALEPQGLGTAVIASDTGGLSEVVVHEQTGLKVPPNDIDALANAMRYLADNREVATRLGRLGKIRFGTQYTEKEHMRKLEEVYEEERINRNTHEYAGI